MRMKGSITTICTSTLTHSRTYAPTSADFFVHYGHSCLVPVTNTSQDLNMLYVFVDIQIDIMHFCKAVRDNFKPKDRIYLVRCGLLCMWT
jgi:diphthamide biosynthesis enzyme Dph1/Dph2-like protein